MGAEVFRLAVFGIPDEKAVAVGCNKHSPVLVGCDMKFSPLIAGEVGIRYQQ